MVANKENIDMSFEDWVKETKEAYNKLSAEELLQEYTELHDDIRDCDMTDNYSSSYEEYVRRFDIVKFLIIERLKYFDEK